MRISFELAAEFRDGQGKGASRRLRHAGRVPAILYGGHAEPRAITLNHQKLMTLIDNEKFYSSIINLVVGDKKQAAIVKDLQMHPARNAIVHLDMQRVGREREDPHPHPDSLQGRGCFPGREVAGWRGVASHRGHRDLVPAEGSARVHRARSFADEPERVEAPVGPAAAGRRDDPVRLQGQCRGRLDPRAACGRAGTDRRSRCRSACRRRCCSGRRRPLPVRSLAMPRAPRPLATRRPLLPRRKAARSSLPDAGRASARPAFANYAADRRRSRLRSTQPDLSLFGY